MILCPGDKAGKENENKSKKECMLVLERDTKRSVKNYPTYKRVEKGYSQHSAKHPQKKKNNYAKESVEDCRM